MIVAARCCKVVHRTESGLQAHPPLLTCRLSTAYFPASLVFRKLIPTAFLQTELLHSAARGPVDLLGWYRIMQVAAARIQA
jgi:hypothetical protein